MSRQASTLAVDCADHELLAHIAANAFEVALDDGSHEEAEAWMRQLGEAISNAQYLENQFNDVQARGHLAAGRSVDALTVLSRMDPEWVDAQPEELRAANRLLFARAHRAVGNLSDARSALDEVQHLIDAGDLKEIQVAALQERAALAAAHGNYADAYEYHRQFYDAASKQWAAVRRSQVDHLFASQQVVEALKRAEQAEATVLIDPLTGTYSRRWVQEVLPEIIARSGHDNEVHYTLAIRDIDHFKHVNDTYGHLVGDRVLTSIGSCLQGCTMVQSVARIGGEEFLIVFDPRHPAEQSATSILDAVRALQWPSPQGRVKVTASMGLADYRPGGTVESVLLEADQNLYRAKRAGRDTARTTTAA